MKYEPLFKFPEFNVFMTDFFLRAYTEIDPVVTIRNGRWECFSPGNTLKELGEKGFKYALTDGLFEEFESKARARCKEVLGLNDADVTNMSKEEFLSYLDKFFEFGKNFLNEYRKSEFVYFSKIEDELNDYVKDKVSFEDVLAGKVDISNFPEEKRKLAQYIIKMQHFKLELRGLINDVFMGSGAVLPKILEQLVVRTGREDAVSMTLEEFKDCLAGEEVKDVSERHVYSYLTWDGKWNIVSGAEGYRKIRELGKQLPKDEVVGVPACKGLVRGRVKIIPLSLNPEGHFSKFEKGDILVSDTTGPELMVVIEKASAIISDEGGMMSHAAVVSREFGIPCVVGTKYATEVFKDGDYVEVNANSGVVRKLDTSSQEH